MKDWKPENLTTFRLAGVAVVVAYFLEEHPHADEEAIIADARRLIKTMRAVGSDRTDHP